MTMLFGSKEWVIWAGLAGFVGFMLIGDLMQYAELRMGMLQLLGVVAILLLMAVGGLLILARFKNPKAGLNDYIWAVIPVGAVALLLLLMVGLGAI
jgi:hypothetical protein